MSMFIALSFALAASAAPSTDKCSELSDVAIGAALGDSTDTYNLAVKFYTGECVKKSYESAANLWQKAASAGVIPAMNNLGYLLSEGLGVKQDQARAAALWLEAAQAGHSESQIHLGNALFHGYGVPQDRARGLAWILFASESAKHRADDPDGGGGPEITAMAEKEKTAMLEIDPSILESAAALVGHLGVSRQGP